MKRSGPPKRRTRLKQGKHTLKSPKAATRKRQRQRAHDRFARNFHSIEFVLFTKLMPCVCRGKVCDGGYCEVSHDPPRSQGGTWLDTHPATRKCHELIEANDFWHRIGMTPEEANAQHHASWLEYSGTQQRWEDG